MNDKRRTTVEAEAEQGRCYRRRPADDGGEYLLFPDDLDPGLVTESVVMPFPVNVPDCRVEQKREPEASPGLSEVDQAEVDKVVSDFFGKSEQQCEGAPGR